MEMNGAQKGANTLSPHHPSTSPPPPQVLQPGQEPLSLEGFLAQERALVGMSDAQHIANKLLYDSVNEALINVYKAANRVKVRRPPWGPARPGGCCCCCCCHLPPAPLHGWATSSGIMTSPTMCVVCGGGWRCVP